MCQAKAARVTDDPVDVLGPHLAWRHLGGPASRGGEETLALLFLRLLFTPDGMTRSLMASCTSTLGGISG